jgi:uncharacterized membrane protein
MTLSRPWAVTLGLLLAVSLAVNVFIGGLVAGRAIGTKPWQAAGEIGAGAGLRFTLARIVDALPKDQRPVVEDIIRAHRGDITSALRALQAARSDAAAALRAEPFEPVALTAALGELKAASSDLQSTLFEALEDAAAKLTPAGRDALADWRWRSRE